MRKAPGTARVPACADTAAKLHVVSPAYDAPIGQVQLMTMSARRGGPREHGRQAVRSKRDRPERAREVKYRLSHVRAAAGGALDLIEPNSATTRGDSGEISRPKRFGPYPSWG